MGTAGRRAIGRARCWFHNNLLSSSAAPGSPLWVAVAWRIGWSGCRGARCWGVTICEFTWSWWGRWVTAPPPGSNCCPSIDILVLLYRRHNVSKIHKYHSDLHDPEHLGLTDRRPLLLALRQFGYRQVVLPEYVLLLAHVQVQDVRPLDDELVQAPDQAISWARDYAIVHLIPKHSCTRNVQDVSRVMTLLLRKWLVTICCENPRILQLQHNQDILNFLNDFNWVFFPDFSRL